MSEHNNRIEIPASHRKPVGNGQRTEGSRKPVGNGQRTGGGRKPVGNSNKRKRRRRQTYAYVIPAVIVGLIFAWIVSSIIKGSMLRVKETHNEYALGTAFDINNYVEPTNDKAYIEYDNSEFIPDGVGIYKIKYKVVRGKLKKKRTIKISVIDTDIPVIEGPDEISFAVGEKFDLKPYYRVTDSQPDLVKELKSNIDIDTSTTGTYNITLSVTDWYNNSSYKNVVVNVLELEGDALYAAKAVRAYRAAMGVKTDASYIYVYAPDEDKSDIYVIVDNYMYEIDSEGTCREYEYDMEDHSQVEDYQQMFKDVKDKGQQVSIEKVYGFR
ncbi:MAG: immunoglobulin-like domain-containing protein [Coprococcus sp.]